MRSDLERLKDMQERVLTFVSCGELLSQICPHCDRRWR